MRAVVRAISSVVLGPLGSKKTGDSELSEEEFKVLVDAGSAEGEVNDRERRLIHNVFDFGDKTVSDAMRRRGKVFALAYELPLARLVKEIAARGYSRVPIYDRSIDNIRGVLYAKDLVIAECEQAPPNRLSELLHEPFSIPRSTPLESLFSIFKQGKTHMAMVVDEYGNAGRHRHHGRPSRRALWRNRDERELQKSMSSKASLADRTASDPPWRAARDLIHIRPARGHGLHQHRSLFLGLRDRHGLGLAIAPAIQSASRESGSDSGREISGFTTNAPGHHPPGYQPRRGHASRSS